MNKKFFAIICAFAIIIGACFTLVACNKGGGANDFTVWIPNAEAASDYDGYAENPVVKYISAKEWAGTKLNLTWQIPPKSEDPSDNLARAISTNTYADVINATSFSSIESIAELYDDGYLLDLTPYIDKYMPNYKKFLQDNPELASTAMNVMPDGTTKHLQLWCWQGDEKMWGGWNYRRDWLVQYGTNPSTGAKFNGSWTVTREGGKKDVWVDNVFFPSWYDEDVKNWYLADVDPNWDGQMPVTIDDWAWMLGIFKKAISEQGINGGYAMQMYSPGYYEIGDLVTAFGGGSTWYLNPERTNVSFGLTDDNFYYYTQMINEWYRKGYVDPSFNERKGLFFEMDTTTISQGKVGLWYGFNSALCDAIDISGGKENSEVNGYTNGSVVFGARQPINTSYGDASVQRIIPSSMYQLGREKFSFVVTDKAKNKNLEALFTMMDYMYSDEGLILNSFGMSKEQYEWYKQTTGQTDIMYEKVNGEIYTIVDGKYKMNPIVSSDDIFLAAACGNNLWGLQNKAGLKYYGGDDNVTKEKCVNEYTFFRNTGEIPKSMLNQLTPKQYTDFSAIQVKIRNDTATDYPALVKNSKGVSQIDWAAWCAKIEAKGCNDATKIIQDLLDNLNHK